MVLFLTNNPLFLIAILQELINFSRPLDIFGKKTEIEEIRTDFKTHDVAWNRNETTKRKE